MPGVSRAGQRGPGEGSGRAGPAAPAAQGLPAGSWAPLLPGAPRPGCPVSATAASCAAGCCCCPCGPRPWFRQTRRAWGHGVLLSNSVRGNASGPGVRTQHFNTTMGLGSISGQGTEIPKPCGMAKTQHGQVSVVLQAQAQEEGGSVINRRDGPSTAQHPHAHCLSLTSQDTARHTLGPQTIHIHVTNSSGPTMSHSQVLRTHWWRNKSKTKFLLCAGAGVQTDRKPTGYPLH